MYLIQVGPEPVHDVIDGKLFTFPPNEPVEVEDDFAGRAIIEHKAYTGITQVPMVKTRTAINFDVEGAKKRAAVARKTGLQSLVDNYIKTQIEDRLRKNYPAMPPSEVVQKAIDELGIDLSSYGIRPVGMNDAIQNKANATEEQLAKQASEISELKEAVKTLVDQNKGLKALIEKKKGDKE